MIALAYNADLRPKTRRKKTVRHLQTTGYMSKYVYEIWMILARRPQTGLGFSLCGSFPARVLA